MTEDERVFTELVEDVLGSTPGLRYRLDVDEEPGDDEAAYAIFTIETNPAHDLAVAVELARNELRLRVNGKVFALPVEGRRRIEKWIDRRCRDIERLVGGDLRIEDDTLLGNVLASELHAGAGDDWTEIADRDDGWGLVVLLGWLLPFGLSPFRTRKTTYADWFRVD